MTQVQFDTIIKVIENGAPALANELCNSLNDLVNNYNALRKEKEQQEEQQEEQESTKKKSVTKPQV